ncbi:MAG: ABC transporter ATP-binding protein [Clostridiales bacterium]|nr:ABC transporter ATP-binding protein [Clostridiales bacterium]
MNAIELKQVKKRYGDFALNDVNLTLPQGCVLGLIGENGAGKSTLIRMMCGMCKPDGGEVVVLGERAGRSAAFTRVKQDIGVVLDEACLPDELTAPQIAQCMRGIYTHWDDEVFGGFMRRFALPEDKAVRHYSRGMKMKLAIAAAMSHHAKLLLLDEATSGLDPVVRDDILDVFNEFTRQENHSVLISSHIVSDLEKICDYVVFIHKGNVILSEEKDRLLEKYALLAMERAQYDAMPKEGVRRMLDAHGTVRVLMEREYVPHGMPLERLGLEDMMLMIEKGEEIR